MRHISPELRHDFVYLFDVTDGNPNGDPDAGNMPRIDPETMQGLVTDVALKRKVRDYVASVIELVNCKDLPPSLENMLGKYAYMRGQGIFIQSKEALNTLIYRAYKETGLEAAEIKLDDEILEVLPDDLPDGFALLEDGRTLAYSGQAAKRKEIEDELKNMFDEDTRKQLGKKISQIADDLVAVVRGMKKTPEEKEKQQRKARDRMVEDYYDVRMFGAVMSTGLNAGQVRGPVQITFARSIDPILPMDLTITRQARTTTERMKTGATEMGRKPIVPYGLYRAHGFFNPMLAEKVSENDLALLWDALLNMFEHDRSAARGQMNCRGLYVFTHDNRLGNAHAHKLFERIRVHRKLGVEAPRSYDDYVVELDETNMPSGVYLKSTWF